MKELGYSCGGSVNIFGNYQYRANHPPDDWNYSYFFAYQFNFGTHPYILLLIFLNLKIIHLQFVQFQFPQIFGMGIR